MLNRVTILACFGVACGGPPPHEHPEPLSVDEHRQHAKGHEEEAKVIRGHVAPSEADAVRCIDHGLPELYNDDRGLMKPCWTRTEENHKRLRSVDAHLKAAADHKRWARLLIEIEHTACATLGKEERNISPFLRRLDILKVEEHREHGKVLGARVTFAKVSGLSKAWFAKSIACHQARAAKLGYPETFMSHCPLSLPKTATSIEDKGDTLIVTLRSEDPLIASLLYGRALFSASKEAESLISK